jgi:hypothetical protein
MSRKPLLISENHLWIVAARVDRRIFLLSVAEAFEFVSI